MLFDHGCDSFVTFIVVSLGSYGLLLDNMLVLCLILISFQISFYFSTLREKYIHNHSNGIGYVGIGEAQCTAMIILLVSGIWVPQFWNIQAFHIFNLKFRMKYILIIPVVLCSFLTGLKYFIDVIKLKKGLDFLENILPVLALFITQYFWSQTLYFEKHNLICMTVSGIFFGLITVRLIVSNAVDCSVTLFHPEFFLVLIPAYICSFNYKFGVSFNICHYSTLVCGFILMIISFTYSSLMVFQIASFLKINIFRINKPKEESIKQK